MDNETRIRLILQEEPKHLLALSGGKQWTCEKARFELEDSPNRLDAGNPTKERVRLLKEVDLLERAKEQKSWKSKPLPAEAAILAAITSRTLTHLFLAILSEKGAWALKVKDGDFLQTLTDHFELCFVALEKKERIESLTAIVGRIAKLHDSERVVLTSAQLDAFELALIMAIKASGSAEARAELSALGPQFAEMVDNNAGATWKPTDRWREIDPRETAAAYFERTIAPLPMPLRPTTTELNAAQPEFYRALKTLCSEQKRFDRTGPGEIGKARAVSDVLRIGSPKRRGPN